MIGLTPRAREGFYLAAIERLREAEAHLVFVMGDRTRGPATRATSTEVDVTRMFIERVDQTLGALNTDGIVFADRPGGGSTEEAAFLSECARLLEEGTDYVKPSHISLNVQTADSRNTRLLQAADLIVGSTLAFVGGERRYSPAIVEALLPLFHSDLDRIGGVGVKLHPDFVYANLYHWLFGDTHYVRYPVGVPLPLHNRPYASGPMNW